MTQDTLTPPETDTFGGRPDRHWMDGALRAVEHLASTGRPFTLDACRDEPYSLPDPDHPNRWGALARAAVAAKLITPIGFTNSKIPSRHGSVVRVWVGTHTLLGGDAA